MPRFKPVNYDQSKLIPILFKDQLVSGSFEHALDYLVDHELDFSIFDHRYKNEDTGASAYSPAVLLKVVIYAYSRGITSSRAIARLCEENIIFMALSADTRPHFTTIAKFVASLPDEISELFK